MGANAGFVRMTVSLPPPICKEMEAIKEELHITKSEVVKRAVESYLRERKQEKLRQAAEKMAPEYTSGNLVALSDLDSEEFL